MKKPASIFARDDSVPGNVLWDACLVCGEVQVTLEIVDLPAPGQPIADPDGLRSTLVLALEIGSAHTAYHVEHEHPAEARDILEVRFPRAESALDYLRLLGLLA